MDLVVAAGADDVAVQGFPGRDFEVSLILLVSSVVEISSGDGETGENLRLFRPALDPEA